MTKTHAWDEVWRALQEHAACFQAQQEPDPSEIACRDAITALQEGDLTIAQINGIAHLIFCLGRRSRELSQSNEAVVDLREAMRLLYTDGDADFHHAMQLIGKHCGVDVPDLPTKVISVVDVLRRGDSK